MRPIYYVQVDDSLTKAFKELAGVVLLKAEKPSSKYRTPLFFVNFLDHFKDRVDDCAEG